MTLVSLGATMFVSLSTLIVDDSSPTRIAAQVVSGIGFLAGGVILRDGFSVTGLNTAATLWCTAAVGSMIGAGFILEGLLAALLIALTNIVIRFFSRKVDVIVADYQQETTEFMKSIVLTVTGLRTTEVLLRTEMMQQLDRYYLTFASFVCRDLAEGKVQLQVEIEPALNIELAVQEIVANLSKKVEVLEIYQLVGEESSW
ncbi:putative Mg2+ transporter-C (MgtC) family protein [Isobaculum melis]|uniref:Putative Mg2+ transporter-C (MgtC) family protein n=2 Tax=Isobaculum melis TaxID=142588 RepID=A0A1H9Q615_9LACT|nr:putative Mg2+ transporter-C (MgtC) family protein [Isobaculum melis]